VLPEPVGVVRWFRHVESRTCSSCGGAGTETSDTGYTVDCGRCSSTGREFLDDTGAQPVAGDREIFAALGARMTRAEQLGAEIVRRLAPWDDTPPIVLRGKARPGWELVQVTWRIAPSLERWESVYRLPRGGCVEIARALQASGVALAAERPSVDHARALRDAFAAARDLPARGKRFGDFANPFEPMLELYADGFRVGDTSNDKFVELLAFASA
jgi:hypothetical protein